MVRWAGVPPVTWISPSRPFHAVRAAFANVSKLFFPCSTLALAAALATLTYDRPTRTLTVWLALLSNVTNAPDPGPDTDTVAAFATARLVVRLALLGTGPLRTEAVPPLTASLCHVPVEAKFRSNVAE